MTGIYWLSKSFSRVVLLTITILSIIVGLSPVNASSETAGFQTDPHQEAPATLKIGDVMLNLRTTTSVRTKEKLRIVDNPTGFNYDGIFIFGLPAIKITEKIAFGDDDEGLDVGYSTYVYAVDKIWYGIEDSVAILTDTPGDLEGAQRISDLAGVFPFDTTRHTATAKLSKADQKVDGVECDEYAWKKGRDEYSMCVIRALALPVVLNAKVGELLIEVHYSNYNDPENIFRLPREGGARTYYVADAFMGLLGLENFEYKTVYGVKNAKGVQIDSTVQGLFVQADGAWQASEWAKTDDTSAAAATRYVQIGRLRWTAPGDETKPFRVAPVLNPRATIRFTDKFTRATPFLIWMSMVSDKKFKGKAKVTDNNAEFEGEEATKYKFGEDEKKPDDFVEMMVLKESGVPVFVDYHFTEGGRKNVITWELTSMDESKETIESPLPPAKK